LSYFYLEKRNAGTTGRRFAYFQHSNTHLKGLSLFASAGLNLHEKLKKIRWKNREDHWQSDEGKPDDYETKLDSPPERLRQKPRPDGDDGGASAPSKEPLPGTKTLAPAINATKSWKEV
jgi:hypothetical protein